MISVGSRDGREGLSSRYGGVVGGEMMEENELEEGEASFPNNNDVDSAIDPDVTLSYIDEKLQDVLGHFQKDFEGGVSAENLGAKYGGYGSFLPTYQRSPVWPHPKTPPKNLNYNTLVSPNNLNIEGGRQNSVSQSCVPQSARHGQASAGISSLPAPGGPSMNGKVKKDSSSDICGEKCTTNGQQLVKKIANTSDQRTLKVRIKVGSDNLSTRKNAEIYSGLGLDVSPSSSLEASPMDSDGFLHDPQDGPDESPTSILEIMTSFPVRGSLLLSPLPYDLLHLTEKEKWEDSSFGPVNRGSQDGAVRVANGSESVKVDRNVSREKKLKPSEKNSGSMESTNGNGDDGRNDIGVPSKKETEMDNLGCEELVSNALRLPLLSNTNCNVVEFGKGAAINSVMKDEISDVAKEECLDSVLTREDFRVQKPNRKDGPVGKVSEADKGNSDDKNSVFPTKADSEVFMGGKTLDAGPGNPPKQKAAHKATSREKDSVKLAAGKETSSSGTKKKSKGSLLGSSSQNVEVSKGALKNDSSSTSKSMNSTYGSKSHVEDLKKSNGKARETYKDFFGELDLEQEDDDDMALEEKPSGDRLKDSTVMEKGTLEGNSLSKERLNGKKSQRPSSSVYARAASHVAPMTGHGPVPDAAPSMVAPVVNEDWVCCDKCEKWRLLPPGVNPGSLPEKWICTMLDWLPGMNRCSISEAETTTAITSRFFPGPAPLIQGSQPVHPSKVQLGVISVDSLHSDQRNQYLSSQALAAGSKKKHGPKDVPNEIKQDRPTLSSSSAKKNTQGSHRSRSLNGGNQSPPTNDVEFQDSGQSSSFIAEKQRLKHKEKKKLLENFMDEGNNAHRSKIRNKRESSQEYSRESKKVKAEGRHGTDEDRVSDPGEAVFKAGRSSTSSLSAGISGKDRRKHNNRAKESKSASKGSARNPHPQDQYQINSYDGTFLMGKDTEREVEVAKKRKSNEFQDTQMYVEEMSETDHRKEKKARLSKPPEEETCAGKGSGEGADKRGRNVKDEQLRSLDVIDSAKRDVIPVHASLAATSSSSKVSGSHKTKANNQEAKGSPVESVSSSPLRISNIDKLTSSRRNMGVIDDAASPKRCSDGEDDRGSYRSGTLKKDETQMATHHGPVAVAESHKRDLGHILGNKVKATGIVTAIEFENCHVAGVETSAQVYNKERRTGDQSHASGSRPRKNGKGSSSRSKDKSRSSRSDFVDKLNLKISEPMNEVVDITSHAEKLKGGRSKSQEKHPSIDSDKFEKGSASKKESSGKPLSESAKRDGHLKHGHHGSSDVRIDAISGQDVKQKPPMDRDSERSSKREKGKSHSLPPSGRGQSETGRCLPQPIPGSQKENGGRNTLLVEAAEGDDVLRAPKQNKKAENQLGNQQPMNMRHPTPNRHKVRDHDAPSPLRRDSSSQAATNAVKEAKDLKHLADRLKNSGSNLESTVIYFQAALKFLHGASLLESCNSESGKHGDTAQSMAMYSSTAKLCEFCAHEYEKSKEMAAAALAYKCTEVAYLKVVYSSHNTACKDRHDLQTALQIGPTGESPSSSASDLDNLNNPATVDKAALGKSVNSPQVPGNHIIAAQNKPKFVRILNFAQDVNFAMEASRKSRIAFAASSSKPEEAHHREGLSAVKKALDFNFQDVEGLLRLVKLAMEVISK